MLPCLARILGKTNRLPPPSPDLLDDGQEGNACATCEIEQTPSPTLTPPPAPEQVHRPRYTWALDAGHGIRTQGKRSPRLPQTVLMYNYPSIRLLEWAYNADIVKRIAKGLEELGLSYLHTMPLGGDHGNALRQRVRNANEHKTELPKIFVSVHGNAGPAKSLDHYAAISAQGIETWHYHNSKEGKAIAGIFQASLMAELAKHDIKMVDRGTRSKKERQFYVLEQTKMPAVLTENGFFNSVHDLHYMIKEDFRQIIADAHVAAIWHIEKNGYEL
ncbi:MAG: N-acetylmuramoyl-L-alanine amidase [Bacteroidota bacterium]